MIVASPAMHTSVRLQQLLARQSESAELKKVQSAWSRMSTFNSSDQPSCSSFDSATISVASHGEGALSFAVDGQRTAEPISEQHTPAYLIKKPPRAKPKHNK